MNDERPGRHIGLIGGLGVAAGVHYYEGLVHLLAGRGPVEITFVHADVPTMIDLVAANDIEGIATYLGGYLDRLARAGATVAAITAVTPHIAIDAIERRSPLPIVGALDVVRDAVERSGQNVALFGTRATVESDLFGHLPPDQIVRMDDADAARVYDLYVRVARGDLDPRYRDEFAEIAERTIRVRGADAILLAGTDLSSLFKGHDVPFPHMDAAAVHLRAIADASRATASG